jgi:Ca-activated chloride channel family protein
MSKRIAIVVASACVLLGALGCGSSDDDASGGGGYTYYSSSGGSSSKASGSGGTGAGSATPPVYTSSGGTTGGTGTGGAAGSAAAGTGGSSVQATPPATNPFVLAAHDPLSTFAADTDTASYDIFRGQIEGGALPEPQSVRLEDFVNYFDYDYPAPADDAAVPFSMSLAAAPSLNAAGTLLFRVGIQGKPAPAERGPANLVFLIDVSGSMAAANKLPLVQVVVDEALDVLEPSDVISVVTYAGSTKVALGPTLVREKATIRAVIDGLHAGGATAGASGIDLAYTQAESAFVDGGINHVVMCTDGDFNVGASSDQVLLDLITQKRQSGITLTTLGFGTGDLNDSMMERVSDAGNGMYSVITSEDEAVKYAHDRLLSTMLHIAKDMKIQVEFNAEQVLAYRLLGYEDRAIADDQFTNDAVDAGEVGAGHRVTALYELVPAGGVVPAPTGAPPLSDGAAYAGEVDVAATDLALVKVRYKQPGAAATDDATEVDAAFAASDVSASRDDLDADFRWAAAVATFAEVLKGSPYARRSELPQIQAIITADPGNTTGDKSEFVTLFTEASALLGTP